MRPNPICKSCYHSAERPECFKTRPKMIHACSNYVSKEQYKEIQEAKGQPDESQK